MTPEEIRDGLFIVEGESTYKIVGVDVISETGRLVRLWLVSADGVSNLVENTCFRDNLNLAIPKWRSATDKERDAWLVTRRKYPTAWTGD